MARSFPTYWLVTINTHGSWLPGDPRGFQTRRGHRYVPPPKRYARPGEATYNADEYRRLHEQSKSLSGGKVVEFPEPMRPWVLEILAGRIDEMGVGPRVLSVGRHHCHLLARFGRWKIRIAMGQAKAAVTNALRAGGDHRSIWAGNCHMRSKPTREAYLGAVDYVRKHVRERAVIHEWPEECGDGR